MRVSLALLVFGFAAVLAGPRHLDGEQSAAWSATRPLPSPVVFAEGSISTSDDDMDAAFTPDGKSIYFTKNHAAQRVGIIVRSDLVNGTLGRSDIYRSRWQDGAFQAPENLGANVNGFRPARSASVDLLTASPTRRGAIRSFAPASMAF